VQELLERGGDRSRLLGSGARRDQLQRGPRGAAFAVGGHRVPLVGIVKEVIL
jgi:hypothetical protein